MFSEKWKVFNFELKYSRSPTSHHFHFHLTGHFPYQVSFYTYSGREPLGLSGAYFTARMHFASPVNNVEALKKA